MQTVDGQQMVALLQKKAREEGRDLFEVMEEGGWLLTTANRRQIKSDALTEMIRVLEWDTAERVLRRHMEGRPGTAQDMFDAMVTWLQDYREAVVAGHVG